MKVYDHMNDNILKEIIEVLNNDGLIIFPTDTVYGIACNSYSDKAIKKLYAAKKRDLNKPISVLTDSISKIELMVDSINDKERELMDKYFPGNLTIILNKKKLVSNLLTSNNSTIGVRIPNNENALKILSSYPYPLATTSANISGEDNGTKIEDFIDKFEDSVNIVIDGGESTDIPLTIVRVEESNKVVLREGILKIKKLF